MSTVSVDSGYKRLVILLAHMFYSGHCPPAWWIDAAEGPKKEAQAEETLEDKRAAQLAREAKRKAQADTTGLGIIVLAALTERQWVEEDEFARSLNLPPKMVRKAVRYLEEEQLLMREHRKETKRARREERNLQAAAGLRDAKSAAGAAAAAAAIAAGPAAQLAEAADEEEEAINVGHVISYCALDYPRIVDSVRWRLHTIKKNLIRECQNRDIEQRYKCPNLSCNKEYSSMDVFDLMTRSTTQLNCAICGTPIMMLMADGRTGTADERKERIKRAKELLQQYDSMLGPLTRQLDSIENLTAPDFSNYHTWLSNQANVRSHIAAIEKGTANNNKPYGPAPKPVFTANTQVVLNFDNVRASDLDNDGPAAAAAGVSGTTAGLPGSVGATGAGASGNGSKPAQNYLQGGLASHSRTGAAASRKPLPPWLATSMVKQQQQQQPVGLPGAGGGMQHPGELWGPKADPDEKLESISGIKLEAVAKQEYNGVAVMDEDEEWEDATTATESAGAVPAAVLAVATPPPEPVTIEEDDWEDV